MADTDLRQEIIDVLDELGAAVDTDIEVVDEIDDKVSLPGIKQDSNGNFVSYCLAKMSVFDAYIRQTWNAWFGTDTSSGVQKQWADLASDATSDHTTAQSDHTLAASDHVTAGVDHSQAESDHTRAETDHTTASSDHTTADTDHATAGTDHGIASADHGTAETDHTRAESDHSTASSDHTRAESDHSTASTDHTTAQSDHAVNLSDHEKVAGAENLNAQLSGYTVTITNRQGQSTSVDIGFEIYRTYVSVAAMNADAANVPQGKFVVIATTSSTDPDNAKLYCKNSQGTFTFLSDLDQASSAAWADWLDNMKPQIESAITTAGTDHTRAEGDHTTAAADHTQAGTDHSTATSDHSTAQSDHTQSTTDSTYARNQGDYAKNMADHPAYIGADNYWYIWDYDTQQYVKDAYSKGDDLHWDEMSEAEKEDLAEKVRDTIVFADVEVAESIIDEIL